MVSYINYLNIINIPFSKKYTKCSNEIRKMFCSLA